MLSITLQAAGRHQCSYLITLQKQEFLLQGGDQSWLKGLNCIPQKLRNLYDINKILAHRPWLLKRSHIEVSNLFYGFVFLHSSDSKFLAEYLLLLLCTYLRYVMCFRAILPYFLVAEGHLF